MNTINAIRIFIESQKGKIITQKDFEWNQFRSLLSQHPTWKNKIDTIEKYFVTTGFNKMCTVLKIKPTWTTKFILISWRKCKPQRNKKENNKSELINPEEDERRTNGGRMEDERSKSVLRVHSASPFCESEITLISPQLSGAMRNAIHRQIVIWKRQNQRSRQCCQCKSTILLHVDHILSFVQLQRDFLKFQTDIPSTFYYNRKTCQPRFIDKKFARRWQCYHKKHAKLQWLCKTCNLKKG